MELKDRIASFAILGEKLRLMLANEGSPEASPIDEIINSEYQYNEWFTPSNVRMAFNAINELLTVEKLNSWCSSYPLLKEIREPKNIGVVMAGNIPLVGFHDFLSVLIFGNRIIIKTSSKDKRLITYIAGLLCTIDNRFNDLIKISDEALTGFDAVIATGSDNSARYFEYYFGKYPNIIRKNRNSVAILTGEESETELSLLGKDIFSYFGLGCRNVSKIFVPEKYDLMKLHSYWDSYSNLREHSKYANNYDFNKAVFIVNKEPFIDSGYLLMKEDQRISSPVSVLNFEHYDSYQKLTCNLEIFKEKIQCIISKNHVTFGMAQFPELGDYADEKDTLDFLLKKNMPGIL